MQIKVAHCERRLRPIFFNWTFCVDVASSRCPPPHTHLWGHHPPCFACPAGESAL